MTACAAPVLTYVTKGDVELELYSTLEAIEQLLVFQRVPLALPFLYLSKDNSHLAIHDSYPVCPVKFHEQVDFGCPN